jgi:hypothetical protein
MVRVRSLSLEIFAIKDWVRTSTWYSGTRSSGQNFWYKLGQTGANVNLYHCFMQTGLFSRFGGQFDRNFCWYEWSRSFSEKVFIFSFLYGVYMVYSRVYTWVYLIFLRFSPCTIVPIYDLY